MLWSRLFKYHFTLVPSPMRAVIVCLSDALRRRKRHSASSLSCMECINLFLLLLLSQRPAIFPLDTDRRGGMRLNLSFAIFILYTKNYLFCNISKFTDIAAARWELGAAVSTGHVGHHWCVAAHTACEEERILYVFKHIRTRAHPHSHTYKSIHLLLDETWFWCVAAHTACDEERFLRI